MLNQTNKQRNRQKWDGITLTNPPEDTLSPNRRSTESETAVESLRNTELTLIFSLKTSQGKGILCTLPFTELCKKRQTW